MNEHFYPAFSKNLSKQTLGFPYEKLKYYQVRNSQPARRPDLHASAGRILDVFREYFFCSLYNKSKAMGIHLEMNLY